MEREFYTCEYCQEGFKPKRRRVQKYCSNTCRSKAHHARKTTSELTTIENPEIATTEIPKTDKPSLGKVEQMSASGVGNATAGTLLADGIIYLGTAPENRSATKRDIANLQAQLKRYHAVKNLPRNPQGANPYFDTITGEVVYSFRPLYG